MSSLRASFRPNYQPDILTYIFFKYQACDSYRFRQKRRCGGAAYVIAEDNLVLFHKCIPVLSDARRRRMDGLHEHSYWKAFSRMKVIDNSDNFKHLDLNYRGVGMKEVTYERCTHHLASPSHCRAFLASLFSSAFALAAARPESLI